MSPKSPLTRIHKIDYNNNNDNQEIEFTTLVSNFNFNYTTLTIQFYIARLNPFPYGDVKNTELASPLWNERYVAVFYH